MAISRITDLAWEGGNTFTFSSANGFRLDFRFVIRSTAGLRNAKLEFVLGDTPNNTDAAFDTSTFTTTQTLEEVVVGNGATIWGLRNVFGNTGSAKVYARCTAGGATCYSGVKTVVLDAPPILSDYSIVSDRPDGIFISGVTTGTASVKAEGQLGATIDRVTARCSQLSVRLTLNQGVYSGTLPPQLIRDSQAVILNAIDSRGESTSLSIPIINKAHTTPSVSCDVFRCDESGDANLAGGYLSVTVWASSNPTELGISSISIFGHDENGVAVIDDGSGNPLTINSGQTYILGNGNIASDLKYTLEIEAEDAGGYQANETCVIPAVKRVINIKDGNTGIAFFKKAEKDALDAPFPVHSDGLFWSNTDGTENVSRGLAISYDEGENVYGSIYAARGNYTEGGATHYFPQRWMFSMNSKNSSTKERLSAAERYRLPIVDDDLASDAVYDILTNKTTIVSATLNSGTSKTFALEGGTRCLLIMDGGRAAVKGAYIINVTTGGSVSQTAILTASSIAITTAANSITITNNDSSYAAFPCFLVFSGKVS